MSGENSGKDTGKGIPPGLLQPVIVEAVSIAGMFLVMWAARNEHVIRRHADAFRRRFLASPPDPFGAAIWEVRRDISRLERETDT